MTTLAHDEPELTWTQGSGREKRLFSLFSLNTEYEELPTLQRLINNPIMNTTRTLFVYTTSWLVESVDRSISVSVQLCTSWCAHIFNGQ